MSSNSDFADPPLAISILPRPDLQPGDVAAQSQITPGGLTSVGYTVINVGSAPTAGQWYRPGLPLS